MSLVPPALVSPTLCLLKQNSPFSSSISAVEFVLMLSNTVSIGLCLCLLYFMCRAEGRCQPQQQSSTKDGSPDGIRVQVRFCHSPAKAPHNTRVLSDFHATAPDCTLWGFSACVQPFACWWQCDDTIQIQSTLVKNPSLVPIDGVVIKRDVPIAGNRVLGAQDTCDNDQSVLISYCDYSQSVDCTRCHHLVVHQQHYSGMWRS